jgi:hypothetical protein
VTQCNQSVGAIFCDGSYINATDVEQCVSDLNGVLTVKINASGSAKGTVNTTVNCSASPVPAESADGAFVAIGLAAAAAAIGARRRARR